MRKLTIALAGLALAVLPAAPALATDGHEPSAEPSPPVLECPEYTVPGWLDENGNPTSCVGDHPCPGLDAPECVPAVEPSPEPEEVLPPALPLDVIEPEVDDRRDVVLDQGDTLPETGVEPGQVVGMIVALAMLVGGTALVLQGRRRVEGSDA